MDGRPLLDGQDTSEAQVGLRKDGQDTSEDLRYMFFTLKPIALPSFRCSHCFEWLVSSHRLTPGAPFAASFSVHSTRKASFAPTS